MTNQKDPKVGLDTFSRLEMRVMKNLIMTPRLRRHISDEEDEKNLFAPPKVDKTKKE